MRKHQDLALNLELSDLRETARPSVHDWQMADEKGKMEMIWVSLTGSDSVDSSHPNERIQPCPQCGKYLRHVRKHMKNCKGRQQRTSVATSGASGSGTQPQVVKRRRLYSNITTAFDVESSSNDGEVTYSINVTIIQELFCIIHKKPLMQSMA
jgi:hypothetical protein